MNRLTIDKPTEEMNMNELAHNCMYAKDGWAWYRDYEQEIELRDFIREFGAAEGCEMPAENEDLEETLTDNLQYDIHDPDGRTALVYRLMWAIADLREHLKTYEDICPDPERLKLVDKWYLDRCREITALREQLAGKWVLVEERLPELRKDVLISFGDEYPTVGWIGIAGIWKNSSTDKDVTKKVLAWMLLPEPYRKGT